jgi:hypothetical protein
MVAAFDQIGQLMAQTSPRAEGVRAVPGLREFFESVCRCAQSAGVFASVSVADDRLACAAKDSAEPAEYRIAYEDGGLWVSLVTANRWLSQSIEADLVHTGDKLEELIEEELVDQGFAGGRLPFEHFRSRDMLFTFRSPLPIKLGDLADAAATERAMQCLLAYEACFRRLGDMEAGDDE